MDGVAAQRAEAIAETLAETAYRVLRADIIAGVRPPRERLRIERLKETYDIGPTPLREALQRLCMEGLVVAHGNRGFSVAPLDPAELRDLNIARTEIECAAVRRSIMHGDDDWEAGMVAAAWRMRKEDLALRSGTGDLDVWERTNAAFHLATVSACGSAWLLRVRSLLYDQCARYRRASVDIRRAKRDLAGEHEAIAQAVLTRDASAACGLIADHFAITVDDLTAGDRP